jgi:hypothetical protein
MHVAIEADALITAITGLGHTEVESLVARTGEHFG